MSGPLVRAVLASLACHAVVVAVLAAAVGLGSDGGGPLTGTPLLATLAAPSKPAGVPATPPPPAPSPSAPATLAPTTAPLPVPLAPPPIVPDVKGSPQGMVTINLTPPDHPADPEVVASVARSHPEAVRGTPDFEVLPRGIYPAAAVPKRLQIDFLVPVVVLEDGRVEIVPGTFFDPLFGPAIRAGIAHARARPALDAAGRTVPLWSVLSFAFEFAGDRPQAQ